MHGCCTHLCTNFKMVHWWSMPFKMLKNQKNKARSAMHFSYHLDPLRFYNNAGTLEVK